MRRPVFGLAAALAAVAVFTGGLAWLLNPPQPPRDASRVQRLWYGFCVECHGVDGRGSWRAALFLLRPGDLADARRMAGHTDQFLFDIIRHGGAPFGKPGMPAFGSHLSDQDSAALVKYVRGLARAPAESAEPPRPAPTY